MTVNRLIVGDNREVLPTLHAESIDACVTDPPYGIGFMGREWDTFKPGVAEKRVVDNSARESSNPNLNGRKRSPAASPASVEYNRSLEGQRGFQSWTEGWAREVFRVLKPGAHLLVCGAPRSYHRMASGLEDAGFEIRDCMMWVFGSGFPKSHNLDGEWDGWGTALKPAWEPIVVARRPLIGTVSDNVMKHGPGALNIDRCRVETDDVLTGSGTPPLKFGGSNLRPFHKDAVAKGVNQHPSGRWPANLIHDGSDEVLECFPDAPGQLCDAKTSGERKFSNVYGKMRYGEPSADSENNGSVGFKMRPGARRLDAGSAARFFYCAKTSRQDRNDGCDHMERKPLNWSSGTQSPGTFQAEGTDRTSPNNHPTVKPTALMRYLVRLVTPPGGTVLDPFFGSGSTGKACVYEGFNYIGIEQEQRYADIAEARIAFAKEDHLRQSAQQKMEFA